jgi:hypothetical protein
MHVEVDFSTQVIETVNSYKNMVTDEDWNHIIFSCQMINNMQSFLLVVRAMYVSSCAIFSSYYVVEIHFAYFFYLINYDCFRWY